MLFIFGDSYLDVGNNNYLNTSTLNQANFWPYGETFFGFPTGRFSDGRLISDFICEYAGLPLIQPYLHPWTHEWSVGANFASAGAGALVGTFQGYVIDLRTQLGFFKKMETQLRQELGDEEAEGRLSQAVYLFSIGTNDYTSLFLTNSSHLHSTSTSRLDYVGMVVGNVTSIIQEIYERGGGRKFAFLNLPPLGCLPGIRVLRPEAKGSCLEEASLLANLHNQALSWLLAKLEDKLQGFKYSLFDTNTFLRQMMDHPSKYALSEGRVACCGTGEFRGVYSCGGKRIVKDFKLCDDPSQNLFWDSYHPTEAANEVIADRIWNGDPDHLIVRPYSLKQLFSTR
ncbi:hypothetical protein MLD38_031075 [Melastoma candidum]|uniref:Uncharacterized protein n=1 Tax=Melastoma candidum TaxID=119954 RepID=A0ACB9MQI6_9MYRT|nr:hypothetical protein MLD38_031075 [Melastoma candidum]